MIICKRCTNVFSKNIDRPTTFTKVFNIFAIIDNPRICNLKEIVAIQTGFHLKAGSLKVPKIHQNAAVFWT